MNFKWLLTMGFAYCAMSGISPANEAISIQMADFDANLDY